MDMGDFAGGLLKYVREHPVARVTIGGGFGKITKLAQGAMDLHSGRSQVDFEWLAKFAPANLHEDVKAANTAQQVLDMLGGISQATWQGKQSWRLKRFCVVRRLRRT